jgi:hypothetical protein
MGTQECVTNPGNILQVIGYILAVLHELGGENEDLGKNTGGGRGRTTGRGISRYYSLAFLLNVLPHESNTSRKPL